MQNVRMGFGWDLLNHVSVTCDSAELNSVKRCGTEFTHFKVHYYLVFTDYDQTQRLVVAVDLDHQCVSSVPMLFCSK